MKPSPLKDLLPGSSHEEWYAAWRQQLEGKTLERERELKREREARRAAAIRYVGERVLLLALMFAIGGSGWALMLSQ